MKTALTLICFFFIQTLSGLDAFQDPLNLETAVQDDKVMQDFELESLWMGGDHSQKVKATPIRSDYSSKDYVNLSSSTAVSRLNEALVSYNNGISAKTLTERKKAFNQALLLYMEAGQHSNSGMIEYNIGNSFYQLEEYAWAILYYYKALKRDPNDSAIKSNLLSAQEKLNVIPLHEPSSFLERILSFNNNVSFPERLFLFFLCSLFTLITSSAYIWKRSLWIKKLAIYSLFLMAFFLINTVISQYSLPIEGVVVENTYLYRNAGRQYPTVDETPVWAGTKVQVITDEVHGKWLKITTPEGLWGYIPYESVRII